MFGIFSYTATILIFMGGAFVFSLIKRKLRSSGSRPLSPSDRKAMVLTFWASVVGTAPAEWVALSWHAWVYDPTRSLHTIVFGAEIETYLFAGLAALLISYAALKFARREDRKRALST